MERIYMTDWKQDGQYIDLTYSDNDVVRVTKTDFDRAFGAMLNADKEAVVRDFAVKDARTGLDSQISSAEDKKIDGNKPLAEKEKACSHDGLCM